MKWFSLPALLLVAAAGFAQGNPHDELATRNEPPALGVHWAKGARPARVRKSANMTWHNGTLMNSADTVAIWWGTSWSSSDPDGRMAGMDRFYNGFAGTNYAMTNHEYTGSNNTQFTGAVTHHGYVVDNSAASGGSTTTPIANEVCKLITNGSVASYSTTGYYAVYTDLPRGSAGYCAWHSYSTCNGAPIQIAFFWKLDGDAGCDPNDTQTGNSQALAAVANVSGHELSEAVTDPRNGGWYDAQGNENADKCAWTFNVPYVTFNNSTRWKIQGNWSNNAYNSQTGYPNSSGQNGCLDGH